MSVTRVFLSIQNYIHKLTGTSILAITAEMAGNVLLDYISQYAFLTLLAFLLFCALPIYFASHESWTAARIRRYLAYLIKFYFYSILLYLLVCLPYAYRNFIAPKSRFNKSVTEMRECAYRFEESECTTQTSSFYGKVRGVDRECFALAMCLRQPMFLLQVFYFFQELLTTFLDGQSFEFFSFMAGTFVVWAMGSGWWKAEVVENVVAANTPPNNVPSPAAPAAAPATAPVPLILVEDGAEQNIPGIQLNGVPIPEIGANLAAPAGNRVQSPPLFAGGGNVAPPQPIARLFQAHRNPLEQNPIPDILRPGFQARPPTPPAGDAAIDLGLGFTPRVPRQGEGLLFNAGLPNFRGVVPQNTPTLAQALEDTPEVLIERPQEVGGALQGVTGAPQRVEEELDQVAGEEVVGEPEQVINDNPVAE